MSDGVVIILCIVVGLLAIFQFKSNRKQCEINSNQGKINALMVELYQKDNEIKALVNQLTPNKE